MMVFLQKDIWGKPRTNRQAFVQEANQRSDSENVMAVFAPYLMESPEKAPAGGLQSPPEKPAFVQEESSFCSTATCAMRCATLSAPLPSQVPAPWGGADAGNPVRFSAHLDGFGAPPPPLS